MSPKQSGSGLGFISSDASRWPFGETLEYALAALEREIGAK
jgi:hypothetical protein